MEIDTLFVSHYNVFDLGITINPQHESITLITMSLGFWKFVVLFGGQFGEPEDDDR